MKEIELAMTLGSRVLLRVIELYQGLISPALPPSCRFSPSCSEYTYQAIETYGAVRGMWLGLSRLIRCHPFNPGGYDPVPQATHFGDWNRR